MRTLIATLLAGVCLHAASSFPIDRTGVVGRSDVVLSKPNLLATQAMPLGNGRLGVAVWSAEGLTAQLNRVDTMPGRLSPGQVVIPGLTKLTSATDYSGRLDLYHGELAEQGGGMRATIFVQPDSDVLVVDVTGAEPATPQTAILKLWTPRTPKVQASGRIGTLAESWLDNANPGASGRAFGTFAAISAQGRNVRAAVTDGVTVTVSFTPEPNGHFRVLVAAPHFNGTQNQPALAKQVLSPASPAAHQQQWQAFWQRTALIKATSADGAADYFENLRHLYLYWAAASSSGEYPGSQAGLADLFSSAKDLHRWDPSAFWHWNLRMQVAANLGAGLPELNEPYFCLYREALPQIEAWTREHMAGREGICVPETMRFNGPGYEYEASWGKTPVTALNCDASFKPYYNARTLSTGAEVSLWIWQQYLATNDLRFLAQNYPVMAAAARFLLAYQKRGPDGLEHTSPSNAHEQQWDTIDPTTDLAARMALFPVVIDAAQLLGRDTRLAAQLKEAIPRIPSIPRTPQDTIAESYDPEAKSHNFENIGLELVWPYNIIGDTSPLFSLAQRTYQSRPYRAMQDWSFDPVQAARLGLGGEVGATLLTLTNKYQTFVNGFANWGGTEGEFYIEQAGVVAAALEEALVQDYDGIIRIAPAIPSSWGVDGTVAVRSNTSVHVQFRKGTPVTVVIESGSNQQLRLRNPWPGQGIVVFDGVAKVPITLQGETIAFPAKAGGSYRARLEDTAEQPIAAISGQRAASVRKLRNVQIGL